MSAEDNPGVDPISFRLYGFDRTRAYTAVAGYVIEPKSRIVLWGCVTKEHFFSIDKRRRHGRHPSEVLALKLPEVTSSRGAHGPKFNKPSILVASDRGKAPLN